MTALAIFIGLVWLAWEINTHDADQPAPADPYRLDRWRNGERSPDA